MESLHTKWFHCYSGGLLGYQSINSQSQIIPLLHFCLVVADDKRDDLERQGPDGRGHSRQHQQQDRSRGTKRKHSSSQDDCGGGPPLHDMVNDSVSPHNALSLLYQTSVADESYLDEKYGISDKNKLDAKNSRRKMERPRKRKKESESDGDGGTGDTITDLDNPGSPSLETILNGTADSETQSEPGVVTSAVVSSSAASHHSASSEVGSPSSLSVSSKLKSPTGTTTTPEDLTVKNRKWKSNADYNAGWRTVTWYKRQVVIIRHMHHKIVTRSGRSGRRQRPTAKVTATCRRHRAQ